MSPTTKEQPAKSLADAAVAIGKLPPNVHYKSAAALVEAAAPGTARSIATQVRGVMRSTNQGVGRGNRYNGLTAKTWTAAYKAKQAQTQRAKDTAKAAKATSKKETKKETAKA